MEPAVEHERAPSAPPRRPDRPDAERPAADEHAPARTTPGLSPRSALALQRKAGNRAVAALAAKQKGPAKVPAQRATTPAAAQATSAPATASASGSADVAVAPAPEMDSEFAPRVQRLTEAPDHRPPAASDPKFKNLKTDVSNKASTMRAHPPATKEADAAAKAAKPPADDKEAQGKAANAEKMNAAKPGEFDKAAFIKAVNDAIARQAPKNLDEADKFGKSGKADGVKQDVSNKVADGKKQSSSAIETTTKAAPDLGAAKEKPVEPLAADKPPATPGTPDPSKAIPDKAPPAATDFSQGPKDVNAEMAENQVTEEQLAKGNEPAFDTALKEKKAGEEHAKTAPGEVRAKESETLTSAKADAQAEGANAMKALSVTRNKSGQDVSSGKGKAQSEDERKRAEVTGKLQKVFDATKTDVEKILSELDGKVDAKFSEGEKAARDAFTAQHKSKMDAYKDKRYSGFTGKLKWVKDKFAGLPEEANQIFVEARKGYVTAMQGVISNVADLIGTELGKAKQRISKGREDLQLEVQKLPKDLQAIGKQAAGDFSGKFDELTEQVNSKQNELVDTLATKYNDALKAVDEEIAAEKEKNKGLVAKAMDAVAGVIKTIIELKNMLMNVLAKAVQAVMAIIKDPIGFLGNLINAIGSGLKSFMANIAGHLKKGLIGWLLGTASGAGLQLPAKFDLQGILGMIASLLGLTWAAIRGRIVQKGVPEPAMVAVESSLPIAKKLASGGVAGIWEDIKEQVGDLKENLLGKITEYLVPTVLVAGITWIISLLNPASAFIKACKAIIDIVTFIFTRGAQIMEFVNSVLDAIIAIAKGGGGGVGALIENALAKSIPVLIGFLAALLGVGGIADKVKKFFQALSKPVMKAVDWVVGKIVGLGKKIWAKLKDKFGKKKDGKDPAGKDGKGPQKAENPVVKVSFEMAGAPHTLTFKPEAEDAKVLMASELPDNLISKFSRAHTRIDDFRVYMESIEDPDVKKRFQTNVLPWIEEFLHVNVMRFRSIYKQWFPSRMPPGGVAAVRTEDKLARIRSMTADAQEALQNLSKWAAKTGITDLAPHEIEKVFTAKGREIWKADFAVKKAKIDAIIAKHSYKGQPVQYKGSMISGLRGLQKGKARYDPKDFDVDMYVVHPAEFARIKALKGETAGSWVAGDAIYAPELLEVSDAIASELAEAFPGVKGIGKSKIVLRKNDQ